MVHIEMYMGEQFGFFSRRGHMPGQDEIIPSTRGDWLTFRDLLGRWARAVFLKLAVGKYCRLLQPPTSEEWVSEKLGVKSRR
jgi:hypothetical protein